MWLVVERVEDLLARPARANQAHTAQQPELMGDGRLGQPEELAMSQTHSSVRDRASRMRTRVMSPSTLKVSANAATETSLSSLALTSSNI